METQNKVTIIGAGFVGSTVAYSLISANLPEEIALIDIDHKLVKSQVMDLQHSVPFWGYCRVKVGTYQDIADSDVVVIAAGAGQKPGETRLDLVKKNSKIIKQVVPQVFDANPNVPIVMISNPVDVLTYLAINMYPDKKSQILGTGTILDSSRFQFLLGQHLNVNPQSIHAYIVGEHGDSELPLWSTATVGNSHLDEYKKLSKSDKQQIFKQAKNAAYAIIEGKQATYYAIGAGTANLIRTILFDDHTVLPVSHLMQGEYGLKDVCLSMPAVVGCEGIVEPVPLKISRTEKKQLKASAKKLKEVIASVT